MGKKLNSHPVSLKFKVVLESFTTNNVAETARKYRLNANQLSTWRSYFQEQGPTIFQTDASKLEHELEKQVATLEQLLGKKELEIQLLNSTWIFTPRELSACRVCASAGRARSSRGEPGVSNAGDQQKDLLAEPGA